MSKMRMYKDAEQELTDAFFNLMELNRHIFNFRVIIKDKYEPYHTEKETKKIADLVSNLQEHQLEVLYRIQEIRNIFKDDDD